MNQLIPDKRKPQKVSCEQLIKNEIGKEENEGSSFPYLFNSRVLF